MSGNTLIKIPKHVAIIMDGNRRWAKQKGLSMLAGHDFVSEKALEPLVDEAIKLGIKYLTFWAFSTENWQRSKQEIQGVMRIFRKGLVKSVDRLNKKGVRLKILGDIEKFPEDISRRAKEWIKISRNNRKITVCFALNYGGRDEILRAFKKLTAAISNFQVPSSKVSEKMFSQYLDTAGMPDPDLIIRTGGEQRLSGFMSWQSAYSELVFTKTLMPDFRAEHFRKAVEEYGRRWRRYGR